MIAGRRHAGNELQNKPKFTYEYTDMNLNLFLPPVIEDPAELEN